MSASLSIPNWITQFYLGPVPGVLLLARAVAASAATAGLELWLREFSLHVLVDLTLGTLFYCVLLLLLHMWKFNRLLK
jgi:hypothetical protein